MEHPHQIMLRKILDSGREDWLPRYFARRVLNAFPGAEGEEFEAATPYAPIDIEQFIRQSRSMAAADRRRVNFRVARKPGGAWLSGLTTRLAYPRRIAARAKRPHANLLWLLLSPWPKFLVKAYVGVLGRKPDIHAYARYESPEKGDWAEKVRLLELLMASPEGRKRRARIVGLTLAIFLKDLFKRYRVDLADLMARDGADFIENCYEKLFGRRADPDALISLSKRLADHAYEKIFIVQAIASSAEARARGAEVPGLARALARAQRQMARVATLESLLQWEGAEFIRQAYLNILGRDADANGVSARMPDLKDGWHGKVRILQGLRYCPEGRAKAARIKGLRFAVFQRRLTTVRRRIIRPPDVMAADLLRHEGAEFIHAAYQAVLKRPADPGGLASQTTHLDKGWAGKIDVLLSLRWSAEGRAANVRVGGLRRASIVKRLQRRRFGRATLRFLAAMRRAIGRNQHDSRASGAISETLEFKTDESAPAPLAQQNNR